MHHLACHLQVDIHLVHLFGRSSHDNYKLSNQGVFLKLVVFTAAQNDTEFYPHPRYATLTFSNIILSCSNNAQINLPYFAPQN